MKALILILFLSISSLISAQPNTEVFLFDISKNKDGQIQIANPINISQNEGYDNQPAFWPDGKSVLYSRTVEGQTEIARYSIKNGKTAIITNTLQGSEYSPTPTPDGRISSIRLDTTGLQLLYAYDLKGEDQVLVKDLVIGYHTWVSDDEIISFVLGDTITMQLVNVANGESQIIGTRIGRSLHKVPGTNTFSFVDKSGEKWMIKSRDLATGETTILTETQEGSEDYCWTPDREIIMGGGEELWVWTKDNGWRSMANLSEVGLNGVSRLAVSPKGDKLVLVVNQ